MVLASLKPKTKTKKKMQSIFRTQLEEDIDLIQKEWIKYSNYIKKREYAFNYWVINRMYSVDENIIPSLITEYNDKAIDCFVHYPDSKELFIIQNKYYAENSPLDRKYINDFLKTPLIALSENRYSKSPELQLIFNQAKDDPEYKINLHFYFTSDKRGLESDASINNFNVRPPISIKPLLNAKLYDIDDIRGFYYGHTLKDNPNFKFTLQTKFRGNTLRILPKDYDMPEMSEAYYMLTPVSQLYYMYKEAKNKKYELFEDNIREYLGRGGIINRGIIETLKNKSDRSNFFYYNNGVTIICKSVGTPSKSSIEVIKPQVINGCQTVNSIFEVLKTYTDSEINDEFKQVFVMVKILVFDEIKQKFYRDIVKFTNKQNYINENAFGAKNDLFESLQKGLKERGFLLLLKPSDRNKFISEYTNDPDIGDKIKLANEFSVKIGVTISKLSDIFIPLEKLLQVYLAFVKDGFYAFTKKDSVLKETSDIYKDISLKINENLTFDNMIRLYLLYLKAEIDKDKNEETNKPIPYYIIGFLGKFMVNKEKANHHLDNLFGSENNIFPELYNYLSKLTIQYRKSYFDLKKEEYNTMIKKPIDESVLTKQIETLNDLVASENLKKYILSLS